MDIFILFLFLRSFKTNIYLNKFLLNKIIITKHKLLLLFWRGKIITLKYYYSQLNCDNF